MKAIIAILAALAALGFSSHALAASNATIITKEIKAKIANGDYKSIKVDGITYLVTMTMLETGENELDVIRDMGGSYNIVTNTKLPLYGVDDASFDIKNNILSITYGYAHDGVYETTLKFQLSSWSSPPKLDSLLISFTTLVSGREEYSTEDSKDKLSFFTEISEFNFISNRLKIWSGACTNALQRLPSTKNVSNFACTATYEVSMPNLIKYSLQSININDFMNWAGFVTGFVEMNCVKRSRCAPGHTHGLTRKVRLRERSELRSEPIVGQARSEQ